ncbi:MAG: SDR family NAD(P)-dependent oxidoreductase [Saprospiraceae bacterium]|nr:SDR family oxidoreductase [Lewinella sp.]
MLTGKNILIIGGTSGMGLSAAKAFIRQGARVVATGKDAESCVTAQKTLGNMARIVECDAREEYTAEQAIAVCRENWGELHGLYHIAGGSGRRFGDGPLHEMSLEGWNATFQLNLNSMMLSNRAAIRTFRQQGQGGAILNMGSVLGFSPSPAFFTTHAYAAAKSAVIGFSRSIAAYYAAENIRVNVIAPGLIDTPMAKRAAQDQTIQDFIHTKQPLDGGRIGQAQDLDAAASLLLSDAGRFITGQVLSVDGGWQLTEGQIPKQS